LRKFGSDLDKLKLNSKHSDLNEQRGKVFILLAKFVVDVTFFPYFTNSTSFI